MRRWSTWPRAAAGAASSALAAAVFAFLDVLDVALCLVYALVDGILEESPARCYCHIRSPPDDDEEASDTLYARRSAVRDALLGLVRVATKTRTHRHRAPPEKPRWSDCGCKSCVAWRSGAGRLHVVAKEPDKPNKGTESDETATAENNAAAIFVHGFTSSSSLWAETVFRESSVLSNTRLFAVDLLGFGQSPKPADCLYRLRDHVEAIETSLIEHNNLSSFHLVAHSMGCIIALALAAKRPHWVKSITLVAPPYFLACEHKAASQVALSRLAEKKLWPPLLFGSAVMSWYEHVGRTVCLLLCKNHRLWEWLYTLLITRKRDVDFRVRDLTKHTHHSGWHTMHNVICGGARLQDRHLEAVQAAGIPVMLVHGVDDPVVPVECSSRHLKAKLPRAELRLMPACDHATVLLGRERGFAEDLAAFWSSSGSRGAQDAT